MGIFRGFQVETYSLQVQLSDACFRKYQTGVRNHPMRFFLHESGIKNIGMISKFPYFPNKIDPSVKNVPATAAVIRQAKVAAMSALKPI